MSPPVALLLIALALAPACSRPRWVHPTAAQAQIQRDNWECVRDSKSPLGRVGDEMALYAVCMQSKGYQQVWR